MSLHCEIAQDWGHLHQLIFDDTWNPEINRFRSTYAFRGLSSSNYELQNSLSRLGKPYSNMEKNLIKQFKKYAYPHVTEKESEWHLLSIAQHYGLPTRLLDWTYSPMAALHFATSELDKFSTDGAVWKVDFSLAHSLLQARHLHNLDKLGARIFSTEALAETIPDLDALDKEGSVDKVVGVFFEPPAIDDRIVNQFAYFSALSDPFMSMDEWLKQPEIAKTVAAYKIIIPADIKWEVRDKLDQSNINERVLFPGLDGLCSWLKRHYMPV